MSLNIRPLTPQFAAEVTGFSIREGVDESTFARIEAAFNEHSLLIFPEQPVDDETQIAFSERFGVLEETLAGVVGAKSMLQRISNTLPDGSIKPPGSRLALFAQANQFWHTDSSFKVVPAMASLLSARIIPPAGGDTEFASTRAAYESLSADQQARLENLIAIHSITHSREMLDPKAISEEQKRALPPVHQALVRVNPVTGRKSLLIGSHLAGVVGKSEAEAAALNEELLAVATQPAFVYRHSWQVGDIIMWDNRAVLHRGLAYDEVNDVRLLFRTTVAGLGPTVVDGHIVEGRNSASPQTIGDG